jgi:DHA1 family bicyclomycin/chloramphenicol resistance-like MFS transporter
MIVVASIFFNGTALPMVTIIALCAAGAFVLARLTLSKGEVAAPAE